MRLQLNHEVLLVRAVVGTQAARDRRSHVKCVPVGGV